MTRKLVFAAAMTALLAACGGSQDTTPTSQPTEVVEPVAATASVRLVHASPAAPPVRVSTADGEITASPLAGGTWTPQPVTVEAGAQTFTIAPSGGGQAFATVEADLAADSDYSLFFIGDHTSQVRALAPRAVAIADGAFAPASGMGAVRFVHAVPGAQAASFTDDAGRGYALGVAYAAASTWYEAGTDATFEVAVGGEIIATLDPPLAANTLTTVVVVPEGEGVGAIYITEPIN